jgi:heptosyltransferase-2
MTIVGSPHLLGLFDERFGSPFGDVNAIDSGDAAATRAGMRSADVALLFTGSLRSAVEAWRAGVPRRVGWKRDLRGLFLTDALTPMAERGAHPLVVSLGVGTAREALPRLGVVGRFPRPAPRPFGSTAMELVASLGVPIRRIRPRLEATPAIRDAVRERLRAGGVEPDAPFVVLNAGSRPDSAKAWRGWAELAGLIEMHYPVVIVGGPGEEAQLRATLPSGEATRPSSSRIGRLVLVEPVLDLAELTAVAALSALFITADAGARHVAVAAGRAGSGPHVLVLFGPTDPRHTADHLDATTSLFHHVPCGPCHQEQCEAKDLFACFQGIPAQVVADRALEHLASSH